MKIARIESFILGTASSKDLLFCRVETEDGTHGWGEAYFTAIGDTPPPAYPCRWVRARRSLCKASRAIAAGASSGIAKTELTLISHRT